MLIGAKYEEIYRPVVGDMVYTAADAYTGKQICDMERAILHKFNYQLIKSTHVQLSVLILQCY